MREEGRSAGMETKQGLKEEHNAPRIVKTAHLFFCAGYFREALLATSRFYDVIAVPIVQLVLRQVSLCVRCPDSVDF